MFGEKGVIKPRKRGGHWSHKNFARVRIGPMLSSVALDKIIKEGGGGVFDGALHPLYPFDYTIEPDISGQGLLMGQFAFYLFGFRPEWCHSYSWQCWPFNTSRQLTLPPPALPICLILPPSFCCLVVDRSGGLDGACSVRVYQIPQNLLHKTCPKAVFAVFAVCVCVFIRL